MQIIITQRCSQSYMRFDTVDQLLHWLLTINVGRPVRWRGDELYTTNRLGNFVMQIYYGDRLDDFGARQLADADKERIVESLARAYPPFTYRYVSSMLATYRKAMQCVNEGGRVKFHWCDDPMDRRQFHRKFMQALHERINDKAADVRYGYRKWDMSYTDWRHALKRRAA